LVELARRGSAFVELLDIGGRGLEEAVVRGLQYPCV
jgi:hypothetical protein